MTTEEQKKKRGNVANLKPFKPGQSGNPKGRPKSTISKRERLQLLAEYAKLNPEKANPIEAIREINKMEHVYDEQIPYQDNRQYNIIVSDEKSKAAINRLLEGRPRGEIESAPQDVDGEK